MTLAPFSTRRSRGGELARPGYGYGWDPRREIEDINSRFGQLIRAFFGETAPGVTGTTPWTALTAPVDIEETENAYVVDVDLPNVDPRNINLEMRGEELRVSGTFEERERAGVMRRQNRQTGEFEYTIDLPTDADPQLVEATHDNGVLTVTVQKARDAQPRRIEIERREGEQQRPQPQQTRQGQQAQQQRQGQRG